MPAECWNHCPGIENPADITSRGITPAELVSCKLWRYGPDWFVERNQTFEEDSGNIPEECLKEMRVTLCNVAHTTESTLNLGNILSCENFSCLQRLLRVTAYVLRFVKHCKIGRRPETTTALEAAEIANAETLWLRESQMSTRIFYTGNDSLISSWRRKCGEVKADWVSDIPYSTKHPILLMKSHYLAALIVRGTHERVRHNGIKETLTQVRSKYWIIKGRQFVRQLVHKCVIVVNLRVPRLRYHQPLHYLNLELQNSHPLCIQVSILRAPYASKLMDW